MRYGLIAGNGKFPLLVAEGARRAGDSLSVAAIHEETDPIIERLADRVEWIGIGQLGKMIRFFKAEGVEKAIMAAGQSWQIFRAVPTSVGYSCSGNCRSEHDSLIGAIGNERKRK